MSDLLLGRAKAAKGLPRDPAGRKQEVTREARLLLTSCVSLANQAWGEQDDCVPLWQALAKNCVELELCLAPERCVKGKVILCLFLSLLYEKSRLFRRRK